MSARAGDVEERDRLRVWERSAGQTQACGSAACAATVAARPAELTDRKVRIVLDGGPLDIEWREDNHVLMTGPTELSFTGELDERYFSGRCVMTVEVITLRLPAQRL